jgi:aspartyl-tRNA(Asn)/glutamyl-tRNA(Gln) amidotransferase subunit B
VDLNRAGVPLLEIVSEPDLRSANEVRTFAAQLRSILRYLKVNSGDLEKGVLRIEPNISVRPVGSNEFGTRVEVKNLNSFRALERSVAFEIERQIKILTDGKTIAQQTVGWDEKLEETVMQRTKEGEDDYRYFPEPDLPPLIVDADWIKHIQTQLPELPHAKLQRFCHDYQLSEYDASVLVSELSVANYFEQVITSLEEQSSQEISPKMIANWIVGELFGLLNQNNLSIEQTSITPQGFAELLVLISQGTINQNTAKTVLAEMFQSAKSANEIVAEQGLTQISDNEFITGLVTQVISENPAQVDQYLDGKTNLERWLFGQVMRKAEGRANPQMVQEELEQQLETRRSADTQ